MLKGIRRRIRKHTKAAARTFRSSTLGRAFGAKKWVQKVTRRHPGALRRTVKSRYGRKGFDGKGRIRPEILTKMSHEKGVTGKRARFAKQLRRMGRR